MHPEHDRRRQSHVEAYEAAKAAGDDELAKALLAEIRRSYDPEFGPVEPKRETVDVGPASENTDATPKRRGRPPKPRVEGE